MKQARWIALAACAVLLGGMAFGYFHLRNQLIALDVAAETQWKQVENQLVRQYELLPKLAAVTRSYASHEKEILSSLFEAREHYGLAATRERPEAAMELDGVVVSALMLAERYPNLRADAQFRDLAHEIAGTKNRIALERMRYNELAGFLNTRIRQQPWRLASFAIAPHSYYEAPADSLADPDLGL